MKNVIKAAFIAAMTLPAVSMAGGGAISGFEVAGGGADIRPFDSG